MVVEARWTTDSHTLGDGTFRGDIQPGSLTVRLWDPTHRFAPDRMGAMWAHYKPTNTVWCWFFDSFTRGLVAPGDPSGADCVYTGTPWPLRITSFSQFTNFAAQTVAARLSTVVAGLNAHGNTNELQLPAVSANVAAQSQSMVAVANVGSTATGVVYPSWLQSIRDAAPNGVAWLSGAAQSGGAGSLVVNYARWEANTQRTLDASQIVAGPAVTNSAEWMITNISWTAIYGADGSQTTMLLTWAPQVFGLVGPTGMRLWGQAAYGQTEYNGCYNTAQQLTADHAQPGEVALSTVDLQSGARSTATGQASNAQWDPYAHVFAPTDVAAIFHNNSTHKYRVQKSDHRLTATVWQTTHYLEKYTAATPLP